MAGDLRHRQLATGGCTLHVVEGGDPDAPPVLFLHGWPQSWLAWRGVIELAGEELRTVAIDLPGIGGSRGPTVGGSKRRLAGVVRALVAELTLHDLTVVGHGVGGMVAYAYLRAYDDAAAVVVMDAAVPGLAPWDESLEAAARFRCDVPGLAEALVDGRQPASFGWLFDAFAAEPDRITSEARAAYAAAYAGDGALEAGFDWFRSLGEDAGDNRRPAGPTPITPLLYLRGEREGGAMASFAAGFAAAGIEHLEHDVLAGAGHFAPEEAPLATWLRIAEFIGL